MNSLKLAWLILFISVVQTALSQTISVTTDQGLGFGGFSQTSDLGGTITISNTGNRSSTGSVILLESGSVYFYSIFTITTESTSALTITIDQPTASLTGSNGGTISLQMGVSDPESPTVSLGSPAEVHIGGTLTLGASGDNPPGNYSGDVLITFTVNNQ